MRFHRFNMIQYDFKHLSTICPRSPSRFFVTARDRGIQQVQISKVLELQPQLVTELTERVNQLEAEKVEKKTFEKLVKYVETSLLQLKDDFEEKMASQSSQISQISQVSVEGSVPGRDVTRLSQRMDQLATSCQNSNSGLRELQWKVAKLTEKMLGLV